MVLPRASRNKSDSGLPGGVAVRDPNLYKLDSFSITVVLNV